MSENKKQNYLTKTQWDQVKSTLTEKPDIPLKVLIEKLALPITLSGLCHRLKRNNIPYRERYRILTKEQTAQIKTTFTKTPDMPLEDFIENQGLQITPSELSKRLRRMGVWPKTKTFLTKTQIEQIKAVLSETPEIPLNNLKEKLSLPISTAGLRYRLRKMRIPYKGQRKNELTESDDKMQGNKDKGHCHAATKPKASIKDRLRESQKKVDAQSMSNTLGGRDRNRNKPIID